jgi:hypothetical protein
VAILDPAYGGDPEHPEAIAIGERLAALSLPLADGGSFELEHALRAGPVALVWIGGAEHEGLTAWARSLDAALPDLDARAATLVFVRPVDADAALRWAVDLGLRSAVAGDPEAELAARLDLLDDAGALAGDVDFAALVLAPDGTVAYRKLGGRRPALDELLAVLDGEADGLRCCPGACVGDPCARE